MNPADALTNIADPENRLVTAPPPVPETQYFLTLDKFAKAVGSDFIKHANRTLDKGQPFMVGLSHGQSPAGAYKYILVSAYLKEHDKEGFDYVFLASDPGGRVAGIERNSKAFDSKEIAVVVTNSRREREVTGTPYFLLRSKRIAFLATKSDKRRMLAWLYSVDAHQNESPGFLRYLPNVQKRMTVFIDDNALTWPQIEVERKTPYGNTTIRVDTGTPYNENAKEKLPVIILIHGFLGLNSFDGLLATIPSHQYITALSLMTFLRQSIHTI